ELGSKTTIEYFLKKARGAKTTMLYCLGNCLCPQPLLTLRKKIFSQNYAKLLFSGDMRPTRKTFPIGSKSHE
ncbi:MAG: hypothetical protein AAB597_01125, partial [Patescibacteria group bacterium]